MIVSPCTFAACGSGEGNWVMTSASTNCRLSPNMRSYKYAIVPTVIDPIIYLALYAIPSESRVARPCFHAGALSLSA